jgi:hypothetical protein
MKKYIKFTDKLLLLEKTIEELVADDTLQLFTDETGKFYYAIDFEKFNNYDDESEPLAFEEIALENFIPTSSTINFLTSIHRKEM